MDLVGQTFGKYELIERLGQGGMAEVYKAYQPGPDRYVALKVMHPHLVSTPDFVTRFKREAKSIGQLQHPHIIHVIDFDVANDVYYLVMDYIQGDTLDKYLREKGALSLAESLMIMVQLVDAIEYAHQQGMIHRDIKPTNIMFRDETHTHAILTDFGTVRLLDETGLTVTGALVGTPTYMCPEVSRGMPLDERSDIYSLGLVLYEMITGNPPYAGDSALIVIFKQANEPLPSPRKFRPDLPEAVEALLYKALAKEPDERFQTATAFKKAITQAQWLLSTNQTTPPASTDHIQTIITPSQPAPAEKTSAPAKSWRLWLLVGGGTLLVILLIGASIFFQQSNQSGVVSDAPPTGFFRFADNDTSRTGDFSLELDGVSDPPAGQHYSLWMADETAETTLNLVDQLPVSNNQITVEGSTSQDLLGVYSQVIISLEPDDDPDDDLSNEIAYTGTLPPELLAPLRQIVIREPTRRKGLLPGAEEQLRLAIDHAGFLNSALTRDNLDSAWLHAEHVVNILDGEEGAEFGDLDGDGRTQNPGDGTGVRVYLQETVERVTQAAASLPERSQSLPGRIGETGNNHLMLVDEAISLATRVPAADTVEEAQVSADGLTLVLDQLLNGADLDGNGVIDPTQNEGGLLTLYDDVLSMSDIAIFAN